MHARLFCCYFLVAVALLTAANPHNTIAQTLPAPEFEDQQELPEGTRGERIAALIEALNANSKRAVEHLMTTHVAEGFREMAPMEMHVSIFKETFHQTSGVDFYSMRTYQPPRNETVAIVQDRLYGGWHSLILGFDDDDRIAGIRFTPARSPVDTTGTPLTRDELVTEVRNAVDRGCSQGVFSGAILVASDDEVLIEAACGEASKRFGVPNRTDTKFNLGSMNKMFTAVAVMQLVEDERLRLEDPISDYVDETWLPRQITDRVTIHHLLTHTSGLGSYFNEAFINGSRALYRELDDYKPLVQGDSLAFDPGERFRYSNTGMLLLGVVIESVTGESYFDVVRNHVYAPAGMGDTDSYSMDEPVPNLAIGYIRETETELGWRNNLFEHVMKGGPAGGGFSTVGDLHRFAQALLQGKLVSSAALETMWTAHSEATYGYGFSISDGPAGNVVGHSGGFPGLNGNLDIFVDDGYVVAVLANHDRAASPLADYVRKLIERLEVL